MVVDSWLSLARDVPVMMLEGREYDEHIQHQHQQHKIFSVHMNRTKNNGGVSRDHHRPTELKAGQSIPNKPLSTKGSMKGSDIGK